MQPIWEKRGQRLHLRILALMSLVNKTGAVIRWHLQLVDSSSPHFRSRSHSFELIGSTA